MDAAEFASTSMALLKTSVGWQSKIADRLGVDRRTVVRWLAADAVPDWAVGKLAELMGARDIQPWPRDEWIIGEALSETGQRREYIVHAAPPRFIARIVACDDDGLALRDEEPADIVSGIVYASGDAVLCELVWIDEPRPGEVVQLLEAAADEIERDSKRPSR